MQINNPKKTSSSSPLTGPVWCRHKQGSRDCRRSSTTVGMVSVQEESFSTAVQHIHKSSESPRAENHILPTSYTSTISSSDELHEASPFPQWLIVFVANNVFEAKETKPSKKTDKVSIGNDFSDAGFSYKRRSLYLPPLSVICEDE